MRSCSCAQTFYIKIIKKLKESAVQFSIMQKKNLIFERRNDILIKIPYFA